MICSTQGVELINRGQPREPVVKENLRDLGLQPFVSSGRAMLLTCLPYTTSLKSRNFRHASQTWWLVSCVRSASSLVEFPRYVESTVCSLSAASMSITCTLCEGAYHLTEPKTEGMFVSVIVHISYCLNIRPMVRQELCLPVQEPFTKTQPKPSDFNCCLMMYSLSTTTPLLCWGQYYC